MKKLLIIFFFFITQYSIAQNPEIKWHFDMDDIAYGSAASADIDDDGKLEIVFSCYRRDSSIYALNAEDGSLLWKRNLAKFPNQGCNDVAPIIYDVDNDGALEVVVPGSCNPTTFCLDGRDGKVKWSTEVHGSDSPPTIADIDLDGMPEIIHGGFAGYITALNGEDGTIFWDEQIEPSGTINGEPNILDADDDGDLEIITCSWNFSGPSNIKCFNALDLTQEWCFEGGVDPMYHGPSFADIDADGSIEIVVSSQDGTLRAINAENGSLSWDLRLDNFFHNSIYATSMADVNDDGMYEISFFDYGVASLVSHDGQVLWKNDIGNDEVFRGSAIADVTGDGKLDIVANGGDYLYVWDAASGIEHWKLDLAAHDGRPNFHMDHGPIIADFDQDGMIDIFTGGGYGISSPTIDGNYGRVYCISSETSGGPDWTMFRRDIVRSSAVPLGLGTSMKTLNELDFEIFPNPSSGIVHISTEEQIDRIDVYDLFGNVVRTHQDENEIRFQTNVNGIFLIKVSTQYGIGIRKVTIH